MLRYSSNPWDTDPKFVTALLRYNDCNHHDYNPSLDTRASKMIFDKILNIQVKKSEMDYDRRYMVKPPPPKTETKSKSGS